MSCAMCRPITRRWPRRPTSRPQSPTMGQISHLSDIRPDRARTGYGYLRTRRTAKGATPLLLELVDEPRRATAAGEALRPQALPVDRVGASPRPLVGHADRALRSACPRPRAAARRMAGVDWRRPPDPGFLRLARGALGHRTRGHSPLDYALVMERAAGLRVPCRLRRRLAPTYGGSETAYSARGWGPTPPEDSPPAGPGGIPLDCHDPLAARRGRKKHVPVEAGAGRT